VIGSELTSFLTLKLLICKYAVRIDKPDNKIKAAAAEAGVNCWPTITLPITVPIVTPTTKSKKVICDISFIPISLVKNNARIYTITLLNKVLTILFVIWFPSLYFGIIKLLFAIYSLLSISVHHKHPVYQSKVSVMKLNM
jgi:hypothetical protein